MGKNALLVGGSLLILIAGIIGIILITNNNNNTQPSNSNTSPTVPAENETSGDISSNDSSYVEYSPITLAEKSSTNRVLFFYANWCPTCRPADAEFKNRINEIPEGVTLIRVNYNDSDTDESEKALAKKYNVTYQHTFVQIDANDETINTWNGGAVDKLIAETK